MSFPSPFRFSPLQSTQREWLRGQNQSDGAEMILGSSDGFIVRYNTTTSVKITSGSIEANTKSYTLASDTTHTFTSLASAFDFHYVYIDDSASTAPIPVFIDSITEPTFSDSKRGWYNGDDRLIGVVHSPAGSAIISYFSTDILSQKNIRNIVGRSALPVVASNMNPAGAWQVPNTNDGDIVTPVNATSLQLSMNNTDLGSTVALYATSKEQGDVNAGVTNGSFESNLSETSTIMTDWIALGATRKIYVTGLNDDDNFLTAWAFGYGYLR